jgi:hypothetical protein
MINSNTKHIKIRHDAEEVQLVHCSTEVMVGDKVTTEFAQEKFTQYVTAMMLEDTRLDQSGRLENQEGDRPRFER